MEEFYYYIDGNVREQTRDVSICVRLEEWGFPSAGFCDQTRLTNFLQLSKRALAFFFPFSVGMMRIQLCAL